jgi:hypothetical protein
MTNGHWATQAEQFRANVEALGEEAGRILAAALRVPVVPEALEGLMAAAVAFGVAAAELRRRPGKPVVSDYQLLAQVDAFGIEISDTGERAANLLDEVEQAYDQACDDVAAASKAAANARNDDEARAAESDLREAFDRKADCEVAADIMREMTGQLLFAAGQVEKIPDDFSEAYAEVYEHLQAKKSLPKRGGEDGFLSVETAERVTA